MYISVSLISYRLWYLCFKNKTLRSNFDEVNVVFSLKLPTSLLSFLWNVTFIFKNCYKWGETQ